MSLVSADLGPAEDLAKALGVFTAEGGPNPDWFGNPQEYLTKILADPDQRTALISFVDEALGGPDRETGPDDVVWLPIVALDDPALTVSITIDTSNPSVDLGIGVEVATTGEPHATVRASVPLFRVSKDGAPDVTDHLLLGKHGARITLAASVTITPEGTPAAGTAAQPSIGAIGLRVDLPTALDDPEPATFGLDLERLLLPGATAPRDLHIVADGVDHLDDAVLDLVLSLVRAQADAAGGVHPVLGALAGLLGLRSDDAVPDFPVTTLATEGVGAIAAWIRGILLDTTARQDWLRHANALLGRPPDPAGVVIDLRGAHLVLGVRVDTGPSGNPRVTPSLSVDLGTDDVRVEARADLCTVDLVTGQATALPTFGIWAASGRDAPGHRLIDLTAPEVVRAATLRVGVALNAARQVTFVLAADTVRLGTHDYPVLDLTSPDALMDAAGNAVGDVLHDLISALAPADDLIELLLGIAPPAGVTAVPLARMIIDPVAEVTGYWHQLLGTPAAVEAVFAALREALGDTGVAAATLDGDGSAATPWRLPLAGPLALEVSLTGTTARFGLAALTTVDTLGLGCTAVDTRFAATIAEVDFAARTASLLPDVAAELTCHEAGVVPSRVLLPLAGGVSLSAQRVGLGLSWSPHGGLHANVAAPGLTLSVDGLDLPVALPRIAADGSITLPPEGWDAVERVVGHLAGLVGGVVADVVALLGWTSPAGAPPAATLVPGPRLRLADLVTDPATTLLAWLPGVVISDVGPQVLQFLADLLAGAGDISGVLAGSGHPDDPFRLPVGPGLPTPAVWLPPAGLRPQVSAIGDAVRGWRPGEAALPTVALAAALEAEARVAADVRALVADRPVAAGLSALLQRWTGTDGCVAPPPTAPPGVDVRITGLAAGDLLAETDAVDEFDRTPELIVRVALGATAWPDAPAERRIDLSTPGLTPDMFALPTAATGEWFVALGGRADCRGATGTGDGTADQAARLGRLVHALAAASADIALVAVGGAGHAARVVAQAEPAVTALLTLGTALSPIATTAITTQPAADGLRLLNRLLPTHDAEDEPEDEDLALGRALVAALLDLADRPDPGAELRPPASDPPAPRAGLQVIAVFGEVSADQVGRAVTAVVTAGLAERARVRAATAPPPATALGAGFVLDLPASTGGTLAVSGDARLTLFSYDSTVADPHAAISTARVLRARLHIADRSGWLIAEPATELRAVSADVEFPLDGTAPGRATITLHDARVFGRSWEALVVGDGAEAVSAEVRALLGVLVHRLAADTASAASAAVLDLLEALGLTALTGGIVGDAVDHLVRDPAALVRGRLATAATDVHAAVTALLGPIAAHVDLAARSVTVHAGSDTSGRFGWTLDLVAAPSGITGRLLLGARAPSPRTGGLQLELNLAPFTAALHWQPPGTTPVTTVALWPDPDAASIARAVVAAAPALGGQVALEIMRRLDASTKPIIDAALDALGLLGGQVTDVERRLRPLAGLLADPAGWLRGPDAVAANPAKLQGLLDALRPLVGAAGATGDPLTLTPGVHLAVTAAGAGARLELGVDTSAWTPPAAATARLTAGVTASLALSATGPPGVGAELFVGVGDVPGRQAVHVRLGAAGVEVLLRPATGADIVLLPFAGLGSLAGAAGAALPYLLDHLTALPAPVGPLVAHVGDALALRTTGVTPHFDGDRLHLWGQDPVGQLEASAGSIAAAGLTTLADLVDDYLPAAVSATAPTPSTLRVAVGAVALTWTPTSGAVAIGVDNLVVPGIEHVSGRLALGPSGLDEFSLTVGPAAIDTGSVVLRPFVSVAAGQSPQGGRRVVVGMAVDDAARFGARWLLDTHEFALITSDGAALDPVEDDDLAGVALRLVEVVADIVAAVAMRTDAVSDLLDTAVGGTDIRNLLRGVLLIDAADPTALVPGVFDVDTVFTRAHKLIRNLAAAGLSVAIEGLTLTLTTIDDQVGVQVGVDPRWQLLDGDISLWLEADDSWIIPDPPGSGGLFLGVLSATTPTFRPSLTVNGVGVRIGAKDGPLIDSVITIDSIALHVFASFDLTGVTGGGAQLELTNLALAPSGGGSNGIAQNLMRDTGPTPPRPAFSPALAVQKHGGNPVEVTLRAGTGDGPWWIAIRRGFGPLYLEQIGLGVGVADHRIERISVLMDGSVSMFGLTCAVDDLQITYLAGHGDLFNVSSWAIDLAGLAISADMAGLTIAGGLLKQGTAPNIEYLGMLLARFGTYGITIYGGYGQGVDHGERFTAFFAVGAINGPIGGPPAFFLTGIGGGFGINRQLKVPSDLSHFGDYPLIQALDIAAKPQQPMDQLRALGAFYPMKRGTFWFAAGISFNSFALVDGIAVVAVQIGDGLDINLLGLARLALPRPQVALVSIELALLVRFSTSEGVLWVQAQLTDNSWLLYPDVRLTGGFAFVVWFAGAHRGEFVITMGGYHPDFHRDYYPVVPRLGLHWAIGDAIVVEAGSYFALTSEAVMAGGDFHASAHFGPAWADLRFGAHGIIYFDPFRYQVNAYVRISAGVTIDLWLFGEVTISVSLGARVEIQGPQFHGVATFEIGPVELSVPFGESDQTQAILLAAAEFIEKYLDPTPDGALAHAAMVALGALPAKGEKATPDGSSLRPFVVVPEFGLTFTSTVPAVEVNRVNAAAGALTTHNPSRLLGVAPMGSASVRPRLTLTWSRGGAAVSFPFAVTPRTFGAFPIGVWGPPQPDDNRPIPQGDMIEALHALDLGAAAVPTAGGPEIAYYQVDVGLRKPLPFTRTASQVSAFVDQTVTLAGLVTQPADTDEAFAAASRFLAATASPTGLAALRGERQAPPRLGTLGEGLDATAAGAVPAVGATPPAKIYDHFVDPPVALAFLPGAGTDLRAAPPAATTTVKDAGRLWRRDPPTLASVDEQRSRSMSARLVVREPVAVAAGRAGLVAADQVPVSAVARSAPAVVRTAGGPGADQLDAVTAALTARRRVSRGTPGAVLAGSDAVVLALPNAHADAGDGDRPRLGVSGDPARIVVLAHGGTVLVDEIVGDGADVEVGVGAERIVAIGQGSSSGVAPSGLLGWHAGAELPYAGWSTALGPGAVVRSVGDSVRRNAERVGAGRVLGAELAKGRSTVVTRFAVPVRSVVVVLDDPALLGDPTGGRGLLLGLDGADRTVDAAGADAAPLLLALENRNVLAYDVLPAATVTVTVASELGWSLAGVLGGTGSAAEALALISSRGLDVALAPLAPGAGGASRLEWLGPTRTDVQRRTARALAAGRPSTRRRARR